MEIETKVLKDIEEHFKTNDSLCYADFCNIFLKHDKDFEKIEKAIERLRLEETDLAEQRIVLETLLEVSK